MDELLLQSYDYLLPKDLIATQPITPKENAKLLVYERSKKHIIHTTFTNFEDFLPKDTLLVFNDTKVIPARIYGRKFVKGVRRGQGGAKIQALFHKQLEENSYLLQCKGRLRDGDFIIFESGVVAKILKDYGMGFKKVEFFKGVNFSSLDSGVFRDLKNEFLSKEEIFSFLESFGHMPLPPYIKREELFQDREDYNAVFAKNLGAIAAPTASLHFSEESHRSLITHFKSTYITLHVGAGTFVGVSSEKILDHKMHKETFYLCDDAQQKISQATHITAIGTTAARTVEYFARNKCGSGECDLFLHPHNKPIATHALLTNFHLPKTTLLMLVASYIGLEETHQIYQEAIRKRYRFYSYGDGMLIV